MSQYVLPNHTKTITPVELKSYMDTFRLQITHVPISISKIP